METLSLNTFTMLFIPQYHKKFRDSLIHKTLINKSLGQQFFIDNESIYVVYPIACSQYFKDWPTCNWGKPEDKLKISKIPCDEQALSYFMLAKRLEDFELMYDNINLKDPAPSLKEGFANINHVLNGTYRNFLQDILKEREREENYEECQKIVQMMNLDDKCFDLNKEWATNEMIELFNK